MHVTIKVITVLASVIATITITLRFIPFDSYHSLLISANILLFADVKLSSINR